jgi:hypothetical protein
MTSWNKKYVAQFPRHRYLYLNYKAIAPFIETVGCGELPHDCHGEETRNRNQLDQLFVGPCGCLLHIAWFKVKAMQVASEHLYPTVPYFVFLTQMLL